MKAAGQMYGTILKRTVKRTAKGQNSQTVCEKSSKTNSWPLQREVMPMKFIPHEYQRYCIDYIKSHPVSALFLDMGLG